MHLYGDKMACILWPHTLKTSHSSNRENTQIRSSVRVERLRFHNCCIVKEPFVLCLMEIRTYKTQALENASMWTICSKRIVTVVSLAQWHIKKSH